MMEDLALNYPPAIIRREDENTNIPLLLIFKLVPGPYICGISPRRGLPHQAQCPLCDQEKETINHLLVSRVFARQSGSFYSNILGSINSVHSLQILLLICGGKIQAMLLLG
jgi:hypothetical protein